MQMMIKETVAAGSNEAGWGHIWQCSVSGLPCMGLDRRHFGFAGPGGFVEACPVVNLRRCDGGGHLVSVRQAEKNGSAAYEETRDGA
jgi:hypothetical protein